jgi:hypothetical protein
MMMTARLTLISRSALQWVLESGARTSPTAAGQRLSFETRLHSRGLPMAPFAGPAEALVLALAFLGSRGIDLLGKDCRALSSAFSSLTGSKVVVLGDHGRESGLRELTCHRFQDEELGAFSRDEAFADLCLDAAALRDAMRYFTLALSVLANGEVAVLQIVEVPS